jgi:hypothetical protein
MYFKKFPYDDNINLFENYKKILSEISVTQQSESYKSWQKIIFNIFNIDKNEIDFYVKKIYFDNLLLKKSKKIYISKNCNLIKFVKYFIKYFIYFIYIKIKNKTFKNIFKGKILIDEIEKNEDVKLIQNFIKLFNKKDIIINKRRNLKINKKINSIFIPRFIGYYSKKISFSQIMKFFILNFIFSFKLRINLFYLFLKIIDDCFYYELLAKKIKVKYILNFRIQNSNNIKNYFFKKEGTKICYLQKNISQVSQTTFNLKADIFFCYGNYSYIDNKKTFSDINKNVPVGSFYMNNNFYIKNIFQKFSKVKKNYDILYIGSNSFYPNGPWDKYDGYSSIYLEHLNWLKNLLKTFPNLKIIFKHNSNNINNFEKNYFKDTKVEFVDQALNTYDLATKSKLILSWGSSMILELKSITNNAYYLNPLMKNIQFLNDLRKKELICITSYKDLLKKTYNLESYLIDEPNTNFCLRSDNVNENIANFLKLN